MAKKKGKLCFNVPTVRCEKYFNTDCINYTKEDLTNIQVSTNDTLTEILFTLNELFEGFEAIIYINPGTGISVSGAGSSFNPFIITNTAPDQTVILNAGSNVTITGTYPNFTISAAGGSLDTDELVKISGNDTTAGYLNGKLVQGTGIILTENNDGGNETFTITNSSPDQVVVLTEGAGIDIVSAYPNFTITHEDTSTFAGLDTSGAQVVDIVTVDTFGHVTGITTRNLTAADIGAVTTDTNLATTDLTQTALRTYDGNGFTYNFGDLGDWNIEMADLKGFYVSGHKYIDMVNEWSDGIQSGEQNLEMFGKSFTSPKVRLNFGIGTGSSGFRIDRIDSGSNDLTEATMYSAAGNDDFGGNYIKLSYTEHKVKGLTQLTSATLKLMVWDSGVGDFRWGYADLGTGLSLTTGVLSNSDLGSSQFIFKNIAVAGQNTVVADSNNDTLTLVAGTNITITTDDTTDSITINSTGGAGYTDEQAQDAIGAMIDSSLTYVDATPLLQVTPNTTVQKVEVVKNSGAVVGTRKQLNFIEGTNVTLTIADDAGNDQVDITIAASGSGGGTVNTGVALKAAYYPTSTNVVDDWVGVEFGNTNLNTKITQQATTEAGLEIKAIAASAEDLFRISSDAGTGNYLVVDENGKSTFGGAAWFTGGVTETAGVDRVAIGVASGTPRMIFEDAGQTVWEIDNELGTFRWFTPGVIRMTLDGSNGDMNLATGKFSVGGSSSTAQANIVSSAANVVGIRTKLHASQSANAFEINTNVGSGGDLFKVTADGSTFIDTNVLSVDAANDRVGINTATPDFTLEITQKTGAGKGLLLSGAEAFQEANGAEGRGAMFINGVNRSGNVQFWLGSSENVGSSTLYFVRMLTSGLAYPIIDSVRGDGVVAGHISIGNTSGSLKVAIGGDGTTIPSSKLTVNGPASVGTGVFSTTAPSEGLLVQGQVRSGLTGTTLGSFALLGNTSGVITIQPQAAAGTYNFNMPTTAGTAGYLLTSQGGGATAMTWTDPATIGGGSGITRTVVVTSGSLTLGNTAATDYTYFVAGAHTLSMPAAAGNTNRYSIKNNHSANITVDTAGAENIEGAASISLAPEEAVDIMSDGTNWFIF